MKKIVVIGAGPAGLYFAIKAVNAGLKNVVIYDPRAGNYTRPGRLNWVVFEKVEAALKIDFGLADKKMSLHIKELERGLYKEAIRMGIPIVNLPFIRFHEDLGSPGVVVGGGDTEQIIEADFVFDCTGSRREVVAAVNRAVPESPLRMETITTPPVTNHILAYVKMEEADAKKLLLIQDLSERIFDPLSYARSIINLRKFGWYEYKCPRLDGHSFGKNKICLYLHAPENLERAHWDDWVQAVLNFYNVSINYQHFPPSPKPRFVYFPMHAKALMKVSYNKGKNLPTVIALGDAQIDPDYSIGHGIRGGIDRIDALFEHMVIVDGKISYFDPEEYFSTIQDQLEEHKLALIDEAESIRQSFSGALELARLKFKEALGLSSDTKEKTLFTEILNEIQVRQNYAKAKRSFTEYRQNVHHLKKSLTIEQVFEKFNSIHDDLTKALKDLPRSFTSELKDAQELLSELALSWKEAGNTLFKNKNIPKAVDAYARALEIYNLPGFVGQYELQELPIYSNLVICYLGEKRYPEAIAVANMGLGILTSRSRELVPQTLIEKIVFNLLRAICQQVQAHLEMPDYRESASLLCRHIRDFAVMYKEVLSIESQRLISTNIADMEQKLASHLSDSGLENTGNSDADIITISKSPGADEVRVEPARETGLGNHVLNDSLRDSTEQPTSPAGFESAGAGALTTFGQFAPPKKPTSNPSNTTCYNFF